MQKEERRGDQTGWPGSPARGRLFLSFDYSGGLERPVSYFRHLKVRSLGSGRLSFAAVMRLNAESEQTYTPQLAKNNQPKEVQQVVAGVKTALRVASSQSLPMQDPQATN